MTTIAAIRNNKTWDVVLCHDWRMTTTTHLLCSENAKKLIQFDNFALLWCGSEHLKMLIEHKYRKIFKNLLIENEEDVLWFYQIYHDNILTDAITKVWDSWDERRHSADFIVITKNNIYWLNTLWEFTGSDILNNKTGELLTLYTAGSWWDVTRDYIEWYLHTINIQDFSSEVLADILKAWAEYAGKRVISCNSNITIYKATDLFV